MYYEGKLSQEELNEKGWKFDPFDGHNITTKVLTKNTTMKLI